MSRKKTTTSKRRRAPDPNRNRGLAPKILLYLGAGASHFAGYRTFASFPVLLFDSKLREEEGLKPLPANAETLLEAVKEALESIDGWTTHDRFLWRLNEYQQILTLNLGDPAVQPYLCDATRLHELHLCTTEAINVMANTTVHHYSRNRVKLAHEAGTIAYAHMRKVISLYRAIARLNGDPPYLPIFTTNYDMLIEDMWAEFNHEDPTSLSNGLPRVNEEGVVWAHRNYESTASSATRLDLFRLHGCACWFYHQAGDGDIYFHRNEALQQSVRNLCAMYPGLERERGAGPHGYGFRRFYDLLQTCQVVVFVGFSFRDDDVMHVLLKVLSDRKKELKILIVDNSYSAHNVQSRLSEAARRSTFHALVPDADEITALKVDFGSDEDFDRGILETCRSLTAR